MLFKDKLFELRRASGLTQKQLADKAGLSMLTYRNYEQGTRLPGVPMFMGLVKALGVPCEVFAECEDVALSGSKRKSSKTPWNRPVGRPPKAAPPAGATKKSRGRSRKGK
jgi:transcriptional regulator with XRE-family HTH domain